MVRMASFRVLGGAKGRTAHVSTVRTYMAGQRPRPIKMVALARALGPEDGTQLLRVFDYEDMIDDFAWTDPETAPPVHVVKGD